MKRISLCALAAQFGLPLAVHAQAADPADPSLAVLPALHTSAFGRKSEESALPPPDAMWRRANDTVRDIDADDMPAMPMPPSASHEDEHGHKHGHHHPHGE